MTFLSLLTTILTSGLPCCLLALGIFLTYRVLDFADLTAEGSFLIGGSLCVSLITVGVNPFLATLISAIGGAACGFITGILNTKLNIPKLLSGIITMTASASIALLILGMTKEGQVFWNLCTLDPYANTIFSYFYIPAWTINGSSTNAIMESIVMAVIVVLVTMIIYYFFGTEYGMAIRATGMNEKFARAQGINTDVAKVVCVTISNALIGLAGALYSMDSRSMDVKSASGFLVIGLASILIGEAIFGKRTFKNHIISVVLGAIVYFVIVSVAIRLGFPTQLKNLLYAVLITIALCIPLFKKLFRKIFPKKNKGGVANA